MCFRNASLKFLILSMLIMWLSFGVCLTMLGSEIGGTMPTYTVKQGEDWISLAAKLQVPLQNLLNLNPDIKSLSAGTGLRVPRVPASAATQTLAGQTPKSGGKGFLQGQGPPRPEGKGGGRLPGGQLPIPPRFTPPAGKPFRPYQPPGGGKAAPPPPAPRLLPPQYKPGVQPRMILPPRPQPVFQGQRREQALSATYPPAPRAPQAGAQATYPAPQWGAGYGATANLRAFPGARATATAEIPWYKRRRENLFGAPGPEPFWSGPAAQISGRAGVAPQPAAQPYTGYAARFAPTRGLSPTTTPTTADITGLIPNTFIREGGQFFTPYPAGAQPPDSSIVDYLVENGMLPIVFTAAEVERLGLTAAELQAAGYEVDQYGAWIRSRFEEADAPAEGGGGGGYGGGGYYGGGGGGGGGGYGGGGGGYYYGPGEETRSYSPTGRQYPSGRFGLTSWRI